MQEQENKCCIAETIEEMRCIAARYYTLTGKPIGVTGEIGEYDAVRLLGMQSATVRQAGYDAIKEDGTKVQIKTRAIYSGTDKATGRMGAINMIRPWDTLMLVLMDGNYNTIAIYEAERACIEHAITRLTSKSRNAGKLAISEFIRIGKKIWSL